MLAKTLMSDILLNAETAYRRQLPQRVIEFLTEEDDLPPRNTEGRENLPCEIKKKEVDLKVVRSSDSREESRLTVFFRDKLVFSLLEKLKVPSDRLLDRVREFPLEKSTDGTEVFVRIEAYTPGPWEAYFPKQEEHSFGFEDRERHRRLQGEINALIAREPSDAERSIASGFNMCEWSPKR